MPASPARFGRKAPTASHPIPQDQWRDPRQNEEKPEIKRPFSDRAGKTTCLPLISGIYAPDAEEVAVEGRQVAGLSPGAIKAVQHAS
jgi:hypothetical protein